MTAFCAAVDWGTTSFRLWLLDHDGTVLGERRSDEGLLSAKGRFTEILETHLLNLDASKDLPVIMCGMVGSQNGWHEAAYLKTPCPLNDVPAAAVRVPELKRDIRILPGLSQSDPADVMRGEETQLLGLNRDGIICLPGTHSKWAKVENGQITEFSTWMTGELFALLSKQSILSDMMKGAASNDESFRTALNATLNMPEQITNSLFGLRAQTLLGQTSGGASALSGMLIGLELVGVGVASDITLIANNDLGDLYASGLNEIGATVTRIDATATTQAGLFKAAKEIWRSEKT